MITVIGGKTKTASLEDLRDIPLQKPDKAKRLWKGIQHRDLAVTLIDEVRSRGWKVGAMSFALSPDLADLAGAFELFVPDIEMPEGQTLSMGFLTSNALRRRLKIVVGSNVLVCHNGMATGEIVLNKRHTTGLELFAAVEGGVTGYFNKAKQIPKLVNALRERELAPGESSDILMEAGRQHLLPWSRIGAVDHEYRQPTFAEHGTGTSWALLNAFTHIVKSAPALSQMERMNSFRKLLPSYELAS